MEIGPGPCRQFLGYKRQLRFLRGLEVHHGTMTWVAIAFVFCCMAVRLIFISRNFWARRKGLIAPSNFCSFGVDDQDSAFLVSKLGIKLKNVWFCSSTKTTTYEGCMLRPVCLSNLDNKSSEALLLVTQSGTCRKPILQKNFVQTSG